MRCVFSSPHEAQLNCRGMFMQEKLYSGVISDKRARPLDTLAVRRLFTLAGNSTTAGDGFWNEFLLFSKMRSPGASETVQVPRGNYLTERTWLIFRTA